MDYERWKFEAEQLLVELRRMDFGYPLGNNVIIEPKCDDFHKDLLESTDISVIKELESFYRVCDGILWPNVFNNYTIFGVSELGVVCDESIPVSVKRNDEDIDIILVGVTGECLLTIRKQTGHALLLPEGCTKKNVYYDDECSVRVISECFSGLVARLLEDLRAFVNGDQQHEFLEQMAY